MPNARAEAGDQRSLADDRDHDEHGDQRRLGDEGRRVDEHPDRHEEQDREQVAERDDLGRRLVRQVRLGHDDPADERAEGERQPEHGARDEGRQQRGRDDRRAGTARSIRAGRSRGRAMAAAASRPRTRAPGTPRALTIASTNGPIRSPPASGGSATMNTIVAMSWTIDQPIAARPWRLSISPRSISDLITTRVDEIDRQAPTTSASRSSNPSPSDTRRPEPEDQRDLEHAAGQRHPPDGLQLAQRELDAQREQQQDRRRRRRGRRSARRRPRSPA